MQRVIGGMASPTRRDDPFAASASELDSPVLGPSSYKQPRLSPHKKANPRALMRPRVYLPPLPRDGDPARQGENRKVPELPAKEMRHHSTPLDRVKSSAHRARSMELDAEELVERLALEARPRDTRGPPGPRSANSPRDGRGSRLYSVDPEPAHPSGNPSSPERASASRPELGGPHRRGSGRP